MLARTNVALRPLRDAVVAAFLLRLLFPLPPRVAAAKGLLWTLSPLPTFSLSFAGCLDRALPALPENVKLKSSVSDGDAVLGTGSGACCDASRDRDSTTCAASDLLRPAVELVCLSDRGAPWQPWLCPCSIPVAMPRRLNGDRLSEAKVPRPQSSSAPAKAIGPSSIEIGPV